MEKKGAMVVGVAALLVVAGCSKGTQGAATETEPSQQTLSKLLSEQFEKLGKGVPAVMTATGDKITLRPKLHDVRKEKCEPMPQAGPDSFECHVTVKISLNGGKPGEQGQRVMVRRDAGGQWVLK